MDLIVLAGTGAEPYADDFVAQLVRRLGGDGFRIRNDIEPSNYTKMVANTIAWATARECPLIVFYAIDPALLQAYRDAGAGILHINGVALDCEHDLSVTLTATGYVAVAMNICNIIQRGYSRDQFVRH